MGYDAGRPRIWRLEAFTSKSQREWGVPGCPGRRPADNDGGLTNAVRARFAQADLYLCEWHLRHALERLMGKIRTEDAAHRDAIDELLAASRGGVHGALVLGAVPRARARRRHPQGQRGG